MISVANVPDEELAQTMRLMKAEIIERGWSATTPYGGSPHFFIDRGDGEPIHVFSATPHTTSFAAAHLANNKAATYEVLKEAGLVQLESFRVTETTPMQESIEFMNRMGTVVVKPADGAHGKGITVGISTVKRLEHALKVAEAEQKSIHASLIQKQYPYNPICDIRIAVINYQYVAATWRVAARVYGDGEHTIAELVAAENASEQRGKAYFAPLAEIDTAKVEDYLGERINEIPAFGEEVSVLGIANYGAGGETIDITDQIPAWLKDQAEHAARAIDLPVAGVDFMTAQPPTANSTQEELDASITEINKCPLLAMHDIPTSGTPRGAVKAYVDYLATS